MEEKIRAGAIFIYPTDTIYGIGCDATNEAAVARIHRIKKRTEKPFSVIPPGDEWVARTISANQKLEWGPVTYFVLPKDQSCVAPAVRGTSNERSLGLRMSKHWFTDIIIKAGVPFVSTSVNISGQPHMTSLDDLDPEIRDEVDILIYEGPKPSVVSAKIDLRSAI